MLFRSPKELKSSSAATVAGLEAVVAPGQITLAEAVADPLLMGHIDNGDWLYPADSGLWDNEDKTIYDPCPAGYRVPKRDTTKPFWSSNQTSAEGWEANTEFGWLTIGNPKAVFPVGGYRDDYAVGGFTHCYDRVLYWTAYSSSDSKAFSEDIRIGSSCTMKENPKARGGYIRCVAE